jgi:hypothetical protein
MKKLIYPNLIKTSYSNLWIDTDKVYQQTPLSDKVIYRPTHFIVTHNNKYVGTSTSMYPINGEKTSKEIMTEMKYYAGKNTINISVVVASFHVNGDNTRGGIIKTSSFTTLPIMSKKGGKLKTIDVNFMALLTVSNLYELDDKLMHELISEKMNPAAKTHANLAFTDEQCMAKVDLHVEDGPYLSIYRERILSEVC